MKEPNVQAQKDDARKQFKDLLITLEEYGQLLKGIENNYKRWLNRNK